MRRGAIIALSLCVACTGGSSTSRSDAMLSFCLHVQPIVAGRAIGVRAVLTSTVPALTGALRADAHLLDEAGRSDLAARVSSLAMQLAHTERSQAVPDVEVYLKSRLTPHQKAAIERFLRSSTEVKAFSFESHQQAYARFKKLFHSLSALVKNVNPKALPEYFRVRIRGHGSPGGLISRAERLPGVEQAVVNAAALTWIGPSAFHTAVSLGRELSCASRTSGT